MYEKAPINKNKRKILQSTKGTVLFRYQAYCNGSSKLIKDFKSEYLKIELFKKQ